MPRWNGFLASIRVGGKALKEYAVDADRDSVTSWIISEEGQVFDVSLEVDDPASFYAAYLEVEGIPISRRINENLHKSTYYAWFGKRISSSEVRPFQFARISLTDDEAQVLQNPSNLTRSIIIRIIRMKQIKPERTFGYGGRASFVDDGIDLDANVEVFEKAKILNPHMISFSQNALRLPLQSTDISYKRIDSMDQPFFTFKFRYGPKEFLEAQEIIPRVMERSRVPPPPSNEAGDVHAALRDLERRMAEADRQRAELQSELDRIKGAGNVVVKREAKLEEANISLDSEVIDLTGD